MFSIWLLRNRLLSCRTTYQVYESYSWSILSIRINETEKNSDVYMRMKSLNVEKKCNLATWKNWKNKKKRLKHTHVTRVTYKKYTYGYKKFYYPIILNTISSNDRGSMVFWKRSPDRSIDATERFAERKHFRSSPFCEQ